MSPPPSLRKLARSALTYSGAARIARRFTSGAGVILLFHEIQREPRTELGTGASPGYFERLLRDIRRRGWTFVTLDEAFKRLREGDRAAPFAAVTFDDAYRDNLHLALPILETLSIPACLFVPTGAITKQFDPWWLTLRQLIRQSDVLDVAPMGERRPCRSFDQKVAALGEVSLWIIQSPDRLPAIARWLGEQPISPAHLAETYFMNRDELADFARHPLITVGAHTVRHLPLATLPNAEVEAELAGNKAFLQAELDRPVDHLAYPFGTPRTCGPREQEAARAAGFRAAYTTQSCVVPRQGADPFALPRIDCGHDAPLATVGYRISGLERAIGRRTGTGS